MQASKMISAAALAAVCTLANAAADFKTIRPGTSALGDNVTKLLFSFTLPNNVNLGSGSTNYAVLDLSTFNVEYAYDQVYVNPPAGSAATCNDNGTEDGNSGASVGYLQPHNDANLKLEYVPERILFASNKLVAGTNWLLICTRDVNGQTGQNTGNIDNFSVRGMTLYYHTN